MHDVGRMGLQSAGDGKPRYEKEPHADNDVGLFLYLEKGVGAAMTTLHFLAQYDGKFLGAAEIHDSTAELWSVDGNVDTYIHVGGLYGDELYSVLINQFAADMGLDDSDVYLTPEDESEILYAS